MVINEEIKDIYKDHKAYYKDLGEIKILDWKRDNTGMYRVRYIFDKNILYISGDLGHSVYWLSWNGSPKTFEDDMSLGYFYSKIQACEGDRYSFDSSIAKENIRDNLDFLFEDFESDINRLKGEILECEKEISELDPKLKDYKEELDDITSSMLEFKDELNEIYNCEEYKKRMEMIDKLCSLADSCSSEDEWVYELNSSYLYSYLQSYDVYLDDWIYDVGRSIPKTAELHLAGIMLANKYMEENNESIS